MTWLWRETANIEDLWDGPDYIPGITYDVPPHGYTEGECVLCGSTLDCTFGPNPYAQELQGDDTPFWICRACRLELAQAV